MFSCSVTPAHLEPTVSGGEPSSARLLGATLDVKLKRDLYIESVVSKANQRVCVLLQLKKSAVYSKPKIWSIFTDQPFVRLWNTYVKCDILP